jgi:hypothetical protein
MMTPLCELAVKYRTDKCKPHNYTPFYYDLFKDMKVENLLEVGIGKRAGSLKMWEEFFPEASIYGIDRDPVRIINRGRISCYVADQNYKNELQGVCDRIGKNFDIIIDDGSHEPDSQVCAMYLLKFLKKDGIYFIEDIRAKMQYIRDHVPPGYSMTEYEGKKPLPSGRCERILMLKKI